jgi:hypothetical protein
MKIFAVNMTCARDQELEDLMATTLAKHCPECEVILSLNTDDTPYGNGAGWEASMMKLEAIRQLLRENDVKDTDYVLSVDSDVVFTSLEVFKYVKQHGIIGLKHRPEFSTKVGKWSHMSGALIFLRGDVATRMAELSDDTMNMIRFHHFKPFNLTENEDVVLSYLANYVGASHFDLGSVMGLSSGDFESDCFNLLTEKQLGYSFSQRSIKSFYHLNYCPTQFLGEPVTGKWDIPRILKQKGIEL